MSEEGWMRIETASLCVCVAVFFAKPKLLLFPAAAVQEKNNCLYMFHLSGGRMPTQLRGCHFTDNAVDILPCSLDDSELQDFFPVCHLCTCDGFVFSPAPQVAFL